MPTHHGRVAIVTGAASGIGRAAVERIVADGGSVVAVDRDQAALEWTKAAPNGERIAVLAGDVTSSELNDAAAALAVERFGRLDASVLNAGIAMSGDLLTMPLDELDRVLEVNVKAVVLGIRSAVAAMRQSSAGGSTDRGSIVVTASTSGLAGDPNMWPYNASKGAVINLVRAAALDLGPEGIRVNAVCPGPTETGMTTRIKSLPAIYDALRDRTALQRWGQPSEIAAVISFLASSDASFVTGAAIPVDGGITASTGQFLPVPRPSPS
jgi:meso-butanediol dehydrogenase / (S,S)-butanediol dehydrogenase / diacetyl reductase